MSLFTLYYVGAFALAFCFALIATPSHFCTMGAVSDWINFGDSTRLRAWFLAVGMAMLSVAVLSAGGQIDVALAASNATANPPYRTAQFVWPRYLFGGLLFGIGMVLAGGCTNKALLRLGAGNAKSLVVLLCVALAAALMLFTSLDHVLFLSWMRVVSPDLADWGIAGQDVGAIWQGLSGTGNAATTNTLAGLGIGLGLLFWALRGRALSGSPALLLAGVVGGLVVAGAWWLTAGSVGQSVLAEADFMDQRPYALGAQSLTFVAPTAHVWQFLMQGGSSLYLTFGMMLLLGAVAGSLCISLLLRQWRFEWFRDWRDALAHALGGLLMGCGGVLAMGCTIGQGISGLSVLAVGSVLATASIVFGAVLTMKIQYYGLLYEEASVLECALTALVEMRVLPPAWRRLEAV